MLAQVEIPEISPPPQVQEPVSGFISKLKGFTLPSQDEFVNHLMTLTTLQAVLFLAVGLVYLIYGWKVFKVLVVVNAAVIGAVLGSHLGGMLKGPNMPLFGGLGGGLLLGVVALPLLKYSISVMGGLAGSFLGYVLWKYAADALGRESLNQYAWAGALMGLILLGMMAFIIFKFTIEVVTSFQGAMMTATGLIALLVKYDRIREPFMKALLDHTHLMPLLVAVPAVIGFVVQHSASSAKGKKKPEGK